MKIIFLDVDGVLNTTSTKEMFEEYTFVEDEKVQLLKQLVTRTGAKIVLSSSWRYGWWAEKIINPTSSDLSSIRLFEALKKKLSEYGLELLDHTDETSTRGQEIAWWLESWDGEPIESFVILDDMHLSWLLPNTSHVVSTSISKGLTQVHVDRAVNVLK
jgi:hypothetical protein